MIRAIDQADRAQLWRGIAAGMAIHVFVFLLAFAAARA
jgi:hypothetical protein